ncbi:SDR family oxidoreductase [Azoarcus indigens]|uniref:NADP-dependent 3-hydroxy acid dehydrogenase YdfG n=1 Tax=Azoarcus indigens TaxID=29545 RepID=A0A4R6ECL2_9RHOO|nr:SDR family oxidoreductase [Azoarcus indigens]TDN55906.1 NADP-dependent 3-hydroxy acid dehydrogenase YdfG [Azoarcus indigens]
MRFDSDGEAKRQQDALRETRRAATHAQGRSMAEAAGGALEEGGRAAPVVVITGGSAGIGRATAVEFGRHGWRVAILARGEERLREACTEVALAGGKAIGLVVDVADEVQVEAAAERVEREWGPISVWVNNAMATVYADVARMQAEDFRRVTEVSYLGAVWGTQAALRRMRPRNRGTVVQIGSALAYRSIPLQSAYCAAKAALRGFTDALRTELYHDDCDVHLTMVQLSAFDTPQFDWGRNRMPGRPRPVGRVFPPERAARAIYRAAHSRRREHWVGLPAALAIVGTRVLPGFLDRKMERDAWEGQLEDAGGGAHAWLRDGNLMRPAPGRQGARGRFGAEVARAQQRDAGMLAGMALLAAGLLAVLGKRRP